MDGQPRADAVIVGLGAAGCWAANVLTGHGLDVVAIDAGRVLAPADLPATVTPVGIWGKLRVHRRWVQSRSVSFHPAIEHLYVDDRRHPYRTHGGDPFLWIRGRQVGGRLHTWARMALRLSDADFASWPIGYRDLAPYYARVESFHGLSGARDGIESLPDGEVSNVAAFTPAAALFKRRVEARWPERRVVVPRVLGQRIEPVPAPLRAALATGRLRVLTGSPVARVVLDASERRAAGVECVAADGGRTLVRGERVFLCASAIESVRILLNSRSGRHPDGLGNRHGLLGRYVLDHNFVVATGPTSADYRGLVDTAAARDASPLDLAAGLDFYVPDFATTLAERSFERGFGVQGRIARETWGMGAFGEMLPHADNRITLARRCDAHGIPVVNIRVRRHDNDARMIRAQKQQLAAMAEVAGLPLRMPFPRVVRRLLWRAIGPEVGVMHLGVAIHEAGGARMGDTPESSVTDPRNRLWEVPNVWVTDGACIPRTGCQNPTLTIMALTARACDLAARG